MGLRAGFRYWDMRGHAGRRGSGARVAGSAPSPLAGNTSRPLQPDDPRQLGSYQVIGRLGQGGMGTVFLGRAPDGTAVAIKVIRPELAQRPEFRARFEREAESARRVRRFTTAAVLDADPHGPQPYLVTEFVEGPTLSRHVSIRGPLRPADLEQLAVSVTTALGAIHAAGIVHRDLTPGNVLLSPVGPKVIDFGLAREFNADTELSRNVRQAIGTPGYMSPEQILDSPITSAVDIFAWGAIMIFAATGQPPFGTGRMEAILYRIINESPRLDGVNAELRGLIEVAMAKDPADRPSAEELRTALIGGGTLPPPAVVPPPGTGPDAAEDRPRRWGRRGRGASTSTTPPTNAPTTTHAPATNAPTSSAPTANPPTTPASGTHASGTHAPPASAAVSDIPASAVRAPHAAAGLAPGSGAATTGVSGTARPVLPERGPSGGGSGVAAAASERATPAPPVVSRPDSPRPARPPGSSPHPATGGWPVPGGSPPGNSPPGNQSAPAGRAGGRRAVVLGAALAVLLAAAVAVPLIVLRGNSESGGPDAAERARVAARLAGEATARRAQDPRLADRLSLAAYAVAPTEAARDAVIASFAESTATRVATTGIAYSDLALSPDGATLAGTDDSGRLHLWRLGGASAPVVTTTGSADDHATGVVFDAGGRTLATGGSADAGRVWDVTAPARPRARGTLGAQATPVHRLALSSRAHLLATAGMDSSVGLWNITDPDAPVSLNLLIGRTGPVTGIALRPDGRLLAIAGVGGAVGLWDLTDPRHPVPVGSVTGHSGAVNTVAFSPDGRLLASGGDDGILQVSDVADPAHPRVPRRLTGHAQPVAAVAFTTENQLVSADLAGTVAYWNLALATPTFTALGTLDAPVRALSTTADGAVAAATDQGTITLGSLDPARLRTLACASPQARPSRDEWSRFAAGVPFTDACAG